VDGTLLSDEAEKAEGQTGGEWHPLERVEPPTNNQPASSPLKRSAIASPSSRHATAKESSVLALCCACPRNKGDYWCTIETLSLHFSRTHNCRIAHGFSAPTELHTPPTKPKIYVCRKAARAGSAKAKAKARANRWLPGRRPPLRPHLFFSSSLNFRRAISVGEASIIVTASLHYCWWWRWISGFVSACLPLASRSSRGGASKAHRALAVQCERDVSCCKLHGSFRSDLPRIRAGRRGLPPMFFCAPFGADLVEDA